jgi:5-methylcytosine-specific restriction endonuclease McrA
MTHPTSMKTLQVLTEALGVDASDLIDYLNWCLLEHLVFVFSQDKGWLNHLRARPDAIALFRAQVEKRTRLRWDPEGIAALYKRVMLTTEKHFRKPIKYEDLLRLLINTPLRCSNDTCGKEPPEVRLHIDHIFPASKGGGSDYENLRFLCEQCNLQKSDKLPRSKLWLKLELLRPC